MTLLSPANKKKVDETVWKHNWLYSVVPVGIRTEEWGNKEYPVLDGRETTNLWERQLDFPLIPLLTGYCRNCNRAFSQPILFDGVGYVETQMDIDKDNCVGPS